MAGIDWQGLHKEHVLEISRRYDEFFKRFSGIEAVVLYSGSASQKNSRDDQYWPVATTPHFAHWTPYRETPAMLVILPARRPRLFKAKHSSYWEGPAPSARTWDESSFDSEVVDDLRQAFAVARCLYVADDLSFRPSSAVPADEATQAMQLLDFYRTTKTPFEIASMEEATKIAAIGHKKLKELFANAGQVSELDLYYEYLKATRQTAFTEPYSSILGLGAHAGILHHVHYDSDLRDGELSLLVDAGATFNGLASDITRTWVRGKSPDARLFQALVDGVERVQQSLCSRFVVGTAYEDLHNRSHLELSQLLVDLGLTSASAEAVVSSGASRLLFPHGLGHSLGIQVHDVGMKFRAPAKENPYLRNTSTITAGQVVTVEPGIYFIDTLLKKLRALEIGKTFDWEKIAALTPFGGVRIEDNILATDDGPVNLTRKYLV